jgi:phosphoserine aminotransferase
MNQDQLARGYDPRGRIEEGYSYNTVPPQEKYSLGSSLEKHRQQGGVAREVQQFEKHLNALICVIDELDRRLAVATIPQPESTSHSSVPGPDGSALACQLFSFNGMLSRQINRLEAIYQGVDL